MDWLKSSAMVVLSGGQDSTTCLAWALDQYTTWRRSGSTTGSGTRWNSNAATDQAKKRTSGFFSLDRFRIDPYIPESTTGGIAARITVGKKISRNVLFVYSTSVANTSVRDEIDEYDIFRFEWDISRIFSLVGGRDDRGRLSIDVKFRRRF